MNQQVKSEANWNRQRNPDAYSQISAPNVHPIEENQSTVNGSTKIEEDNIAIRLHYLNQQVLRKINQFIPPLHVAKSQEFRKSTLNISTFWIGKVLNLIETLCYNREQGQQRLKQIDKHIRNLENKRDACIYETQSVKKQMQSMKSRMTEILKENQEKFKKESKEKMEQLRVQMQAQKDKHVENVKHQLSKTIKRLQKQTQTYKRKLDSKENQTKKDKSSGFTVMPNATFAVNQNFEKLMSKNMILEDLKKMLQKRITKTQETNQMFDNTVIQLATKIPKLKKALGITSVKSFGQSGRKQHKGRDNIDLTNKKRMCDDLLFSMEQLVEAAQFPMEKYTVQPRTYQTSSNCTEDNKVLLQKLIETKNRDFSRTFNVSSEWEKTKELKEFTRKQMDMKQGETTLQFLHKIQKSQKQLRQQSKKLLEQFGF